MQHIGFIMDGNRRYAKKIGNIVTLGHKKGGENIQNILKFCLSAQISFVSMWALSKENIFSRSASEIEYIYDLLRTELPHLEEKCIQKGIRFRALGNTHLLPKDIQDILISVEKNTNMAENMTFLLMLAYSGQDEIIRGVQRCIDAGIKSDEITEERFLSFLDTGSYPPPDLIVRTGGDIRHSGYFLYQSAYSEYFFTKTLWPDFGEKDFLAALAYFDSVKRNF
ncbi:di-trans,poly-cis-decaprenylcistransferase, partial [Candidatus Gracilibacteria bacterium]|nr:di-trans,poly-cis-decaprenylcistransferase [Candidatus Gracilibacteria bacterium]